MQYLLCNKYNNLWYDHPCKIFTIYIFFKYFSNSDNLILLVKLEIYTSFEYLKTKKAIFLIITLCGSIYVGLVISNFLMLPFIKVGVTLEN